MIGSLLAGPDETPGEVSSPGPLLKSYRGMGSLGAMARGSADRYFQQESGHAEASAEGIEGQVAYEDAAACCISSPAVFAPRWAMSARAR